MDLTTPTIALLALGALFLVLLSAWLMPGRPPEPSEEELEMARRIRRHNRLLETMVKLDGELGRIPTTREIWARIELEDSSAEIRNEES